VYDRGTIINSERFTESHKAGEKEPSTLTPVFFSGKVGWSIRGWLAGQEILFTEGAAERRHNVKL